jgi:hypothetical protein
MQTPQTACKLRSLDKEPGLTDRSGSPSAEGIWSLLKRSMANFAATHRKDSHSPAIHLICRVAGGWRRVPRRESLTQRAHKESSRINPQIRRPSSTGCLPCKVASSWIVTSLTETFQDKASLWHAGVRDVV